MAMELLPDLVRLGGAVILAAAVLQAAALVAAGWRRTVAEDRRRHFALELLRQRVAQATARTAAEARRIESQWQGYRKFRVERRVAEVDDVASLYLVPNDGGPVASYMPGQYLTLQLRMPDQPRPIIRCYSLSERPNGADYRITVKRIVPREGGKPGLVSGFLYDHTAEGDIIDVKAPAGRFYLDPDDNRPVVLVGGGIGITPLIAMLNAIVAADDGREVWLFYGVRNSAGHVMREHLREVVARHPNIRQRIAYSDPTPDCRQGVDYDLKGHVTIDLLRQELPSNNFAFYVCGPSEMMRSLPAGLRRWGVPTTDIHFEAFGPASVKAASGAAETGDQPGVHHAVTFARAGTTVDWTPAVPTLLDLAERNDIAIESGCRAGHCGTCATVLKDGDIEYLDEPAALAETGSCLVCVAVPRSDVVLDA